MTTKECYDQIGGNYDEAMSRLMKDERVAKFVIMFLRDPSYEGLVREMTNENYDEAFRMAHTLKGVCQNLALSALYEPAHEITELLRENRRDIEKAKATLPMVTAQYERTVAGIRELAGEV